MQEGNVFLKMHSTHLRLNAVEHMLNDHTDNERGNPIPPLHGLLFLFSSKGSFICSIPPITFISCGTIAWRVHREVSNRQSTVCFTNELLLALVNNMIGMMMMMVVVMMVMMIWMVVIIMLVVVMMMMVVVMMKLMVVMMMLVVVMTMVVMIMKMGLMKRGKWNERKIRKNRGGKKE